VIDAIHLALGRIEVDLAGRYAAGVLQLNEEAWEEAAATFLALYLKRADYRDTASRLALARRRGHPQSTVDHAEGSTRHTNGDVAATQAMNPLRVRRTTADGHCCSAEQGSW
jgi:hypothetical protein